MPDYEDERDLDSYVVINTSNNFHVTDVASLGGASDVARHLNRTTDAGPYQVISVTTGRAVLWTR